MCQTREEIIPLLVCWLILLLPGISWDIMGYESDTLPSYPNLRNCSYYVKLITSLSCLFLRFVYRVLIPPSHQLARPRHPICLCAQFIDGSEGHPLQYGRLPPLYVHPNGVDPCGFHCLLYRWIFPLSACPTFLRHPCDPACRSMVEFRQDLEHLPSHHPTLASI